MQIIRQYQTEQPALEVFDSFDALEASPLTDDDVALRSAGDLLELYVATDESSPLFQTLLKARELYLDDLDLVASAAELYGLMGWLMAEQGIDNRGETLEDTADRLSDIDIEADTDRYTDLIFHLKDAVDRLYDLELDDLDE